jgi:hypothetical protein
MLGSFSGDPMTEPAPAPITSFCQAYAPRSHALASCRVYAASADGFTPQRMTLMAELKRAIARCEFFLSLAEHTGAIKPLTLVDVGHALGLSVVAEGVENEETIDALRTLGWDCAQGFHIARPMPGSALGPWLAE